MDPARKVPTLADLEALPASVKGEIIEDVLHTMTRPRGPHQDVAGGIRRGTAGPVPAGARRTGRLMDPA